MTTKKEEKTYIRPTGTSTIDLVFINNGIKPISQRILSNVAVRKHLPVETSLQIKSLQRNSSVCRELTLSRNLEISKLQELDMQPIIQLIQSDNIDKALKAAETPHRQ